MAYIGRDISSVSDRVVLDNITTSATATYNLLLNSVAYVPSSAESLTVSLNGVIQKPQSSYTVSGSTIVFASALTSSDSIDFIIAERAITLTTIGSGTVNTNNLVDNAVTNAKITDGTIANAKLANSSITLNGSAVSLGGSATIGGGKIGQVIQDTKTDTFSTSNGANSPVNITGLSATITPTATSSKVLILVNIGYISQSGANSSSFFLRRGSTDIFIGDSAGSRHRGTFGYGDEYNDWVGSAVSTAYVDTPSTTSATTYNVAVGGNSSATVYINRSHRDNDGAAEDGRRASSIILMEVLA